MRNLTPRHADYTDAGATEIEHGPHWSQLPRVAPRPEIAAAPVPPRLPRAHQVNAADRIVAPTPQAGVPAVLPLAAAPVAFYSFAEEQAALAAQQPACPWAGDTERVAPLPYDSIRPSWIDALDRMWTRFAAPALGMIAGLILVVGYLAYSSQAAPVTSAASAARPVAPPVVMTAELDEPAAPALVEPAVREPTASVIDVPAAAPKAARAKKTKRAPVRINDATPLGDLRPSR